MPVILIVERTGIVKEVNVKLFEEDQLYKKAGFKTANDFGKIAVFPYLSNHQIHVYGKTKGKAGQENKYDFPPPIDSTLFFGNCLLLNKETDEKICDLSLTEWEKTYEKLFGGFEDISDSSEEEEIDEEELRILADPNTKFTKEGYVKDDFIVEDEDEDDDEDEDEYQDEDDDSVPSMKPKAKKTKTVVKKKENKVISKAAVFVEVPEQTIKKSRRPYTKSASASEKPKKNKKNSEKQMLFSSEESEKDARTDLLDELSEEEYFK